MTNPSVPVAPVPSAQIDDAVDAFFGGDAALFAACRAASLAQLHHDLRAGAQASAAADLVALRRTSHNLKSAMLMMGLPDVSEMAAACEDACARRLLIQAQASWGLLADRLEAMITPEPQKP